MSRNHLVGTVLMAAAVVVAATVSTPALGHENRLTFTRPVALPGVVLPAGVYSFDLADSKSTLDVVVVRNVSGSKVFYTGFTSGVPRPRGLAPGAVVTFGEAPAGAVPPIAAWYPIGESNGHQFLYR